MNRIFRKITSVSTRTIGDEVILVPIKGQLAQLQQVFVLNPVGSFIWDHLDGTEDLNALKTALTAAFDVEPKEAENDIRGYIEDLTAHGLVIEVESFGP
jgi:hypothetical protein